jgi:hypothetical protein
MRDKLYRRLKAARDDLERGEIVRRVWGGTKLGDTRPAVATQKSTGTELQLDYESPFDKLSLFEQAFWRAVGGILLEEGRLKNEPLAPSHPMDTDWIIQMARYERAPS